MSKTTVLISLLKEVVKNEVKTQVKKEVNALIKSGVLSYNKKTSAPITNTTPSLKKESIATNKVKANYKEFTKNPILNEILNSTEPFTSAHRTESAGIQQMMGGSVLDLVQRNSDEDWGEISLSTNNMSYEAVATPTQQPTVTTGNEAVDIVAKALNRNYSELVKRF